MADFLFAFALYGIFSAAFVLAVTLIAARCGVFENKGIPRNASIKDLFIKYG